MDQLTVLSEITILPEDLDVIFTKMEPETTQVEADSTTIETLPGRKRKMPPEMKACAVCEAPTQYLHYGMVCQSCRFDKCLLVGMNPKVIQFPDISKANEIVKYLMDRRNMVDVRLLPVKKACPSFKNQSYCYEIDSLLYLESRIKLLRESCYNPTFHYTKVSQVLDKTCELSNAHKYPIPPNWPINMDNLGQNYEYACHNLNAFSKGYCRNWLENDLVIIIEAAKTLPIFYKLNFHDKAKLLEKVAFINTKLMEYFYSAQQNLSTLIYPDGFIPIKLGTRDPIIREPNQVELNVFCKNPNSIAQANLNPTEYVLLKSIIYCYSAIPGISVQGRLLLTEQREAYAQLLLRYLQNHIGEESGAKRYLEILSLIPRLFQISEHTKQIWMQMELMRKSIFNVTDPISKLLDQIFFQTE